MGKKGLQPPYFLDGALLHTRTASITAVAKSLPLSLRCSWVSTQLTEEKKYYQLYFLGEEQYEQGIHPLKLTNLASWYLQTSCVVTGERNAPPESDYKQESNFGAWSCNLRASAFSMDSRSSRGTGG